MRSAALVDISGLAPKATMRSGKSRLCISIMGGKLGSNIVCVKSCVQYLTPMHPSIRVKHHWMLHQCSCINVAHTEVTCLYFTCIEGCYELARALHIAHTAFSSWGSEVVNFTIKLCWRGGSTPTVYIAGYTTCCMAWQLSGRR